MGVWVNMENTKKIDREWILLMKEAKKLGLTKDEIRMFLEVNQGEGSAV